MDFCWGPIPISALIVADANDDDDDDDDDDDNNDHEYYEHYSCYSYYTIAPSPGQLSQSCWWNHLAKNTLLPPDSCPQRVTFLAFLKTTSPWVFRDAASVLIWSKKQDIFQHQTWLIEHQQWIPGIYQQSQGIQRIQSALTSRNEKGVMELQSKRFYASISTISAHSFLALGSCWKWLENIQRIWRKWVAISRNIK